MLEDGLDAIRRDVVGLEPTVVPRSERRHRRLRRALRLPERGQRLVLGARGPLGQREGAGPGEDRRRDQPKIPAVLKAELNPEQKETLGELEKFGWELRFVRHDPEQRPVPVIFDAEREKFAVLDPEGHLDENAFINIR